ncbi:DUF2279 domain-containing protein [Spirochaeta africana]|uniref:Putative periplasmic lipoprotein n=1 Tax=Spirochaeta africana (strain ATCC 700263 / DSM 8902 / Z-7692) TaxID=889378 RepID=H9UMG8_SPIAZ|nr:DUF2279 domain-containing protein [Spirochaeta africana]AFG38711.1 putative periplasmic lipoprotein [Spirochaeta africana DSM 8902]
MMLAMRSIAGIVLCVLLPGVSGVVYGVDMRAAAGAAPELAGEVIAVQRFSATEVLQPLGSARGERHDPWLGRDKFLHWAVSALLYGSSYHFGVSRLGMEPDTAAWAAAAGTLSVGAAKELYDHYDGRFFSWRDMVANTVGAGTGYLLFAFGL